MEPNMWGKILDHSPGFSVYAVESLVSFIWVDIAVIRLYEAFGQPFVDVFISEESSPT